MLLFNYYTNINKKAQTKKCLGNYFQKVINNYFQNNWTHINNIARHNDTMVLVFKDSPIIKYVSAAKATIPVANPRNLPGQRAPS